MNKQTTYLKEVHQGINKASNLRGMYTYNCCFALYALFSIVNIYVTLIARKKKKNLLWEGGREGEKHQFDRETLIGCFSHTPPTGDQTHSPGWCPDWESNRRPFTFQDDTQPIEPHQSGHNYYFYNNTTS